MVEFCRLSRLNRGAFDGKSMVMRQSAVMWQEVMGQYIQVPVTYRHSSVCTKLNSVTIHLNDGLYKTTTTGDQDLAYPDWGKCREKTMRNIQPPMHV